MGSAGVKGRNWAKPGTERGCQEEVQNCHGAWVHIQGFLKSLYWSLLRRFLGDWGWRAHQRTCPSFLLKLMHLHRWQCPTAHTETLQIFPLPPSEEFFSTGPSVFLLPSTSLSSSKPQGDVQSTSGGFYLSLAPAQSSAVCHPFEASPRAAVLPCCLLPAHSHHRNYFILQLAH